MGSDVYEVTGRLVKISEPRQITNDFCIKEFIIHQAGGQYPNYIKFQLNEKNFNIITEEMIGKDWTVKFFINGRAVPNKGYFNTLNAFALVHPAEYQQKQNADNAGYTGGAQTGTPRGAQVGANQQGIQIEDDVPF